MRFGVRAVVATLLASVVVVPLTGSSAAGGTVAAGVGSNQPLAVASGLAVLGLVAVVVRMFPRGR